MLVLALEVHVDQTCAPCCGARGTARRGRGNTYPKAESHLPYNEFTISRTRSHLACARGTMPRAPLGRTGLAVPVHHFILPRLHDFILGGWGGSGRSREISDSEVSRPVAKNVQKQRRRSTAIMGREKK